MVRSFRRGALAAVLALSLAPLAACAAGNSAETLEISPDSPSVTVGDIQVQNAFVLTQPNGPASVSARLFNNGATDQTLQSVQLAGSMNASLSGADGGQTVTVPAQGSVLLGGKGNPAATISSGSEALRDGDVQKAVFVFSSTGPVALLINVTPATGYFEPYGPTSVPPTAAPTAPATVPATPSATAPTDTAPATAPATATAASQ
ncbi:DUF461 domain-containing protein [Streptomyces sp.]|uniref:DUF461 domain-containing protein n=1 Tax=Streptomyces sp. TaxID=1931 RepID=UPI002F3E4242